MTRRLITGILLILISVSTSFAQQKHDGKNMKQWLQEMRQFRTNFIVKELNLTADQKSRFVPLYDAMYGELEKLMHDTRQLERSVERKGNEATDVELEKASEAIYECKGKENDIEMRYFAKFKTVLTPRQLFKLKQAENKFNRHLMEKRRKGKPGK
ncbi:MAG: hypothetical protein NC043_07855 [Muribaculaceae bacterium]|nr:hypothetical protein [Muribaculaceae bacterium]